MGAAVAAETTEVLTLVREAFLPAAKQTIGKNVQIDPTARIRVSERLVIGDGTIIRAGALIEGRSVTLGRECWLDEQSMIGGGSAYEWQSELVAGDFLHLGRYSQVNTARAVTLGSEVGIGIGSKIFTHGAYLSAFEGFPVRFDEVHIGSRVWLPNALVNPGVTIGDDVVVGAMSLVNHNLPAGCFAGGVPARVLRKRAFPRPIAPGEKQGLLRSLNAALRTKYALEDDAITVGEGRGRTATAFDLRHRRIEGPCNPETERLKDQLRRMGIRFRYSNVDGTYEPWPT
jgi:acetyltransferase-like isoleucine patch superfamily enzyme